MGTHLLAGTQNIADGPLTLTHTLNLIRSQPARLQAADRMLPVISKVPLPQHNATAPDSDIYSRCLCMQSVPKRLVALYRSIDRPYRKQPKG